MRRTRAKKRECMPAPVRTYYLQVLLSQHGWPGPRSLLFLPSNPPVVFIRLAPALGSIIATAPASTSAPTRRRPHKGEHASASPDTSPGAWHRRFGTPRGCARRSWPFAPSVFLGFVAATDHSATHKGSETESQGGKGGGGERDACTDGGREGEASSAKMRAQNRSHPHKRHTQPPSQPPRSSAQPCRPYSWLPPPPSPPPAAAFLAAPPSLSGAFWRQGRPHPAPPRRPLCSQPLHRALYARQHTRRPRVAQGSATAA